MTAKPLTAPGAVKMPAVLAAAMLVLAGCASVTRGTSEQVVFDSEPSGAEMRSVVDYPCGGPCPVRDDKVGSDSAYLEENIRTEPIPGPTCVTPCTLTVPRNQDLVVTFTKPGYHPKTARLGRELAPAGAAGLAGNVLVGGVVGVVTDGVTGATTDHKPNPLKVVLDPVKPAAPERPAPRKRG
jgi:hypothetical protein